MGAVDFLMQQSPYFINQSTFIYSNIAVTIHGSEQLHAA